MTGLRGAYFRCSSGVLAIRCIFPSLLYTPADGMVENQREFSNCGFVLSYLLDDNIAKIGGENHSPLNKHDGITLKRRIENER